MKFSLFIFILVSALVHAAIINMQDEWVFSISEHPEQGSSILDIKITSENNSSASRNSDEKKTPLPIKKPQPIRKKRLTTSSLTAPSPSESTPPASEVADKKKVSSPAETAITEKNTRVLKFVNQAIPEKTQLENLKNIAENIAENSASNTQKNNNDEILKTLLNAELAKHFYYPRSAQRKNREGNVILAFTINSDGEIKNIHINKSSGYTILDNAAIKALRKIDANKGFARLLSGRSVEQMLPIRYKLLQY